MKILLRIPVFIGKRLLGFFRWYIGLYRERRWWTRVFLVFISLIVSFFLFLGAIDLNLFWLFGHTPGFSEIRNPETPMASELYSSDGQLIGRYFSENRTPVKYEDVNPLFWKALIDTEDERFYSHYGVDLIGVLGAVKDAVINHRHRGASTLTQQLAKNMFHMRNNNNDGVLNSVPGLGMLIVKSKEWIIASKLEYSYSKEELLALYANTVDFGSNAYGIKTAAYTYFNTTPANLKAEQIAMLVGMLKATTTYNPKTNPENALKRRNQVLMNMREHGDLSAEECDSLINLPITLCPRTISNHDGKALYFREAVAEELSEWCRINGYDLYTSGLKIYTTLDLNLQQYAEEATATHMAALQRDFENDWQGNYPWMNGDRENHDSLLHCGFIAMEPQTGHVKAYVGDTDFSRSQYDNIRAQHQPGSTFKLFVYAEAMKQGLSPCDKRRDEYISITTWDDQKKQETTWAPNNANGKFSGDSIALKSAFARSINSIAVRLGEELGTKNIIATAQRMGIRSALENVPSLPLGSSEVNLLEMVNSYCTVADNGVHHDPMLVLRIEDRNGEVIYDATVTADTAMEPVPSFLMQQMLMSGVEDQFGTSHALNRYVGNISDTDFGGKTGTTNNNTDAWFIGVSPRLVVGTWVGGKNGNVHFRNSAVGQGSRAALPLCGLFLQSVMNNPAYNSYHGRFTPPADADIPLYLYTCDGYTETPTEQQDSTSVNNQPRNDEVEILLDEI